MCARVVVFRPGHVISRHSSIVRYLQRFAAFYPLIPGRLRSCFIEGTEVFVAVEAARLEERRGAGPGDPWQNSDTTAIPKPSGRSVGGIYRAYTLLGSNRPWRDMLLQYRMRSPRQFLTTAASMLLSWLLVGQVLALVLTLCARRFPWLRQYDVHTLKPRSMRELLSLCHRSNFGQVRVVGYNNGVNHFGHRYPGKTIVSTIHCRRIVHSGPHTVKADCGATVHDVLEYLAGNDQELYVVPNYSYVCLGTSFFVPIHGSAVDFSTVADTICRVVLYDPDSDRIISAARDDAAFREHVYDQRSRVVVLRVYLLTKPKSNYFVRRETLKNPSASDILSVLRDPHATNVEIRQSHGLEREGHGCQVLQGSRRYVFARPGASSRRPGQALGSPGREPSDVLAHAHPELDTWPGIRSCFSRHRSSTFSGERTTASPCARSSSDIYGATGCLILRAATRIACRPTCSSFACSKPRFLDYLKNTFSTVRTNPGKHSH